MLIILDSAWEVKVGVAPNFPPTILYSHDILLQESVADYLDVELNQFVYFKYNMTQYINSSSIDTNPEVSMLFNYILFGRQPGDESHIGDDPNLLPIDPEWFSEIKVPYRLAGTYSESEGKFSTAYGSVAIIDCNYILDNAIKTMR